MPKKLVNLKITKVSLVDEGACSAAHITLFKQKEGGNKVMNFEELMKSLTEDQQAIIKAKLDSNTADLTKAKTDVDAANVELEKAKKDKKDLESKVSELEGEVEKATADNKVQDEDELLKSVDPAVREMIQKARQEADVHKQAILKLKDANETVELTTIAKSMNNIGTDETQMVSVLRKAKTANGELYAEVLKVLEVANNIIKDSELLKEKGNSKGDSTGDAWSAVDAKAEEIAKARNITKAKATSVVLDEFPELYQTYLNEMK